MSRSRSAASAHARTRKRGAPRAPDVGAPDGAVLTAAALLAAFGLVMIYSATAPMAMGQPLPPHFVRHGATLFVAALLAAVTFRIPVDLWRWMALPAWGVSVLLLAATLAFGIEANGATRWLAIPGLPASLQAAEVARFATVLAVASLLARARPESDRTLLHCVALLLLPAALLALQPDFGSAALVAMLVGALLFVAGARLSRLFALAGAGVAVLAAYIWARPYALARWTGFLAPWESARDEGFQLVQSFVAFGRGGTFGVGLGDGRQKLSYLPEAHTDFILSVIAEEVGLLGVLVVLGCFAALAVAGLRVARRTQEPFAQLLAFGMTAFLVVPAAVNAGVVMGCLPTTGFTLPFVSFGSNSLAVCALALGIVLRIGAVESRQPARGRRSAARRSAR